MVALICKTGRARVILVHRRGDSKVACSGMKQGHMSIKCSWSHLKEEDVQQAQWLSCRCR